MYGRQTETAIAAMSRLAEVYDGGNTRLAAAEIAKERNLQGPFVAKILTTLSQAGLISGSPGPGGGYTLARPPKAIYLNDVFMLFERENPELACPFGGGVCGVGEPCPLHHKLVAVKDSMDDLLKNTTFAVFQAAPKSKTPVSVLLAERGNKPRDSYRATRPRSTR